MGSELLTKTSAEHRARVPARAMRQAPWTTVPLEHASIRDCISEKEQRTHYSRGVGAAANKSWTSSQRRCVSKSRTTTNTEHLAMEASAGMSRPMSIRDHHAIAAPLPQMSMRCRRLRLSHQPYSLRARGCNVRGGWVPSIEAVRKHVLRKKQTTNMP